MPIRYLAQRRLSASSLVGQVSRQIKEEFGVIADPFQLHEPSPQLFASFWSVTREISVARQVPWPIKEAVAAAVSQSNDCPYCVEIHAAVATTHVHQPLASLLREGQTVNIADPTLRAFVAWALATRTPGGAPLHHPPFTVAQAPEIVGITLVYHYLNRMVQVFLPESLLPAFARGGWSGAVAWRLIGRRLARNRERERTPGAALQFTPAADLPDEFAWAEPSPTISRALAGWTAVIERSGVEALTPRVRAHVADFLSRWQGDPPPLSRAWVQQAVANLPETDHAAGKLALLAAVAPYQIDAPIIEAFRAQCASQGTLEADARLVDAVAWASFQAARRIVSWLELPTPEQSDQENTSRQFATGHTREQ